MNHLTASAEQAVVQPELSRWLDEAADGLDLGTTSPADILPRFAEAGIFRVGVPAECGGAGGDITDAVALIAAVSEHSLAAGLMLWGLFALRCVHPPGGAVAVTAVLGGPAVHALGYGFVLAPVAFQSAVLLSAALVFHAVTGHPYPRAAAHKISSNNALASSPSSSALESANTSGASTVG